MPEITLPDVSLQWSSGGDILKPSDSKIQQGWTVEIPPRQWFNWLDNRQDQAIAHIAQHGISVWSPTLEYQENASYVQGSDGIVYKALTTNTNINPVGGATGNWESAFLTASQAVQVATAAQARAFSANNVYISPLQLANAFTGTNQSNTPSANWQILPGGTLIQSGIVESPTNGQTVTFPRTFPNARVGLTITPDAVSGSPLVYTTGANTSGFSLYIPNTTGLARIRWMALGY